jgi:16S rRNA (cytidine1402-2'-O)-methyltransferase
VQSNLKIYAVPGTLYVAATPIGNLEDCTLRLIKTLEACTYVACESHQSARKLLAHLSISKPLISYRDENELRKTYQIINLLKDGASVVLISDAGTPTISDPGFRIVRECRRNAISILGIPGPSACVTALSISGLPTHAFLFLGFLPPKTVARQKIFKLYEAFEHTLIFFESCHRIERTLTDALEVLGPNRIGCVAKELTKLHETIWVNDLNQLQAQLKVSVIKGEFVLLIAPKTYHL